MAPGGEGAQATQGKWQDWLRNQRGEKSSVRFDVETGEFENYSPAHEARQCKKLSATWVQVTPMSRWQQQGTYISTSAVGHAFDESDEAGEVAFRAATQANHTGNLYRTHSAKVPTAPGEPVRTWGRGGRR